jgi:hypothetical protein
VTSGAQQQPRVKIALMYFLLAAITGAGCSLIYSVYVIQRTQRVYAQLKSHSRMFKGMVHKADPVLGFVPIPNSRGELVMPIGPNIPMRYDDAGFRVPVSVTPRDSSRRPIVLTLGCSFTFGDATAAEHTYPYLVGQLLNGTTKNAGVCGYGFSQMVLLADSLVPRYRPDYLMVQYSTWLIDRAQSPFAPVYYGGLPVPYFYGDDVLSIHPPVFQTANFRLPTDRYRDSPRGLADFLSFLWHVGTPLFVYDDLNMAVYHAKRLLHQIPRPTSDRDEIVRHVFAQMASVARWSGAKLIIVVLGDGEVPVQVPTQLFPREAVVVDAQDSLIQHLPVRTKECYERLYEHWRGSPLKKVDPHPNELAHRIIAQAIVSAIIGRPVASAGTSSEFGTPHPPELASGRALNTTPVALLCESSSAPARPRN